MITSVVSGKGLERACPMQIFVSPGNSHCASLAWGGEKKQPTHLNNNGINFDINTNITEAQEIH